MAGMTDATTPPVTPSVGLTLSKTQVSAGQLLGRPAALPQAAQPPDITTLPVQFTGQAGEYFRIWIVNVLLSVVTLGIYSPWARVRTRQYFYGHTWLDGHNFEYTAQPLALLRGFLLVGVLFVVYSVSQQFEKYQWISFVLLGVFGLLYPWLVYRSLKFNAVSTVYRGLSFHFHGRAGAAYVAYFLILLSVPFTLGLTYPLAVWMQRRYVLQNAAYGTAQAGWAKDAGPVYLIFLAALGVSIGFGLLAALVVGAVIASLGLNGGLDGIMATLKGLGQQGVSAKQHGHHGSVAALAGLVVGAVLLYGGYIVAGLALSQYVRAALLKYSLHDLYIGKTLRLQATFSPVRLAWIGASNTVAQVFTLGLLTPWAAVRRTRYLLAGVQVQTIADLNDFSADATPSESALGEAAHEFFNFDLGF
jgi:uncharacterized membrane protein YjgN (DUF898 family)